MGTLGRIPNGRLVPLLKTVRFLISGRSGGEPSASQAICGALERYVFEKQFSDFSLTFVTFSAS